MIILYAEMGTRSFGKFHTVLSEKAQNGEILYVLRHYIQVLHVLFVTLGIKMHFIVVFLDFYIVIFIRNVI